MTALIAGGVALLVITGVLAGWRRSAKRVGELEVKLDVQKQTIRQMAQQIEALRSAPPDMGEQRRMLRKITGNGGND